MEAHTGACEDPNCLGCWSAPLDEPAPDDLIATVLEAQESNARRLAAITGTLGKPPNLTLGLIDLLADEVMGAGTTRRFLFTLAWEEKVAAYCEAQEAEIRKATAAAGTNGAGPKTLHVPRGAIPGL